MQCQSCFNGQKFPAVNATTQGFRSIVNCDQEKLFLGNAFKGFEQNLTLLALVSIKRARVLDSNFSGGP